MAKTKALISYRAADLRLCFCIRNNQFSHDAAQYYEKTYHQSFRIIRSDTNQPAQLQKLSKSEILLPSGADQIR